MNYLAIRLCHFMFDYSQPTSRSVTLRLGSDHFFDLTPSKVARASQDQPAMLRPSCRELTPNCRRPSVENVGTTFTVILPGSKMKQAQLSNNCLTWGS